MLDYVNVKNEETPVTIYHPSHYEVCKREPREFSQVLHIKGDKTEGMSYGYLELFNAEKYICIIDINYDGPDFEITYCLDLATGKPLKKDVDMRITRSQLKDLEYIADSHKPKREKVFSQLLKKKLNHYKMEKPGKVLQEVAKYIQNNTEAWQKFADVMQQRAESWNKAMEPLREAFEHLSKGLQQMPESIKILSESGWYVSFDFDAPEMNYFANQIKSGNTKYVDDKMIDMHDEMFERICNRIYDNFPHRKAPIEAALNAHKRCEYFLSIPVFFAQIEGMCTELTGQRFFKVRDDIPSTASWGSEIQADTILGALLQPFKLTGVMRAKQIADKPLGINRHDVLHGDSYDYGKKVNSYKVLSLLNYVANTIAEIKEYPGMKTSDSGENIRQA